RSRVLYTGVTNDLGRRVHQHKHSLTPGFTIRYHITRLVLLRGVWRCSRRHRTRKAAQGLGSLTKGAADRAEKPHMGGLGRHFVRGTSDDLRRSRSRSFAPAALRMTGQFVPRRGKGETAPPFLPSSHSPCSISLSQPPGGVILSERAARARREGSAAYEVARTGLGVRRHSLYVC